MMPYKILKLIIINILLILTAFFLIDDAVYRVDALNKDWVNRKQYSFFNPKVYSVDLKQYGRQTLSDYKGLPIVVFGCSFAYGQNLDDTQTFSYKLSKILKRPVVNRAIMAGGLQHMYFQTTKREFYNIIPDADSVIYIMIHDHTRRMLIYSFYVNVHNFFLHYSVNENKLIMDDYKNPFYNFFRSLYTVKLFNHKQVESILNNENFADKITDIELLYFEKTRSNLEKHWNRKINFSVVIYGYVLYENMLKEKLVKNGFNVIDIKDFEDGINKQITLVLPDNHPNEAAWDYFTPLIASKIQIANQ